jgi:hypothetical protein
MGRLYGVNCKGCGAFIEKGKQSDPRANGMDFFVMPLGPIPHECGSAEQYGSDDVVDENGKPLGPVSEGI